MSEMSPLSRLLCGLAWQRARRGQQAQAWRWQGRCVSLREHKSTTPKTNSVKKHKKAESVSRQKTSPHSSSNKDATPQHIR